MAESDGLDYLRAKYPGVDFDRPFRRERFDRLSPIVLGMAFKLKPGDEDLQQDGLLSLWTIIISNVDKPDSFAIASVRHALLDRLRYYRVRRRVRLTPNVHVLEQGRFGPERLRKAIKSKTADQANPA